MSRIKKMVFNDQMEYLEDMLEASLDEAFASKQIEIQQGEENADQKGGTKESEATLRDSCAKWVWEDL